MPVQKHPTQKDITSEVGEAVSSQSRNDPSSADTASVDHSNFPDYFTRSTSQALKATAILLVVFGHFYDDCIDGTDIISDAAQWGVLIFLIVSGMGLTKSYRFNNCGKNYIQKRLYKIMFPLWLSLAFFYILDFFLLHATYPLHEIVLSFIGIIEMAPPDMPLWFIPFILYLYGVFFLISNIRVPLHFKCILLVLTSFGTTALITRVPLLSTYFGGWTIYTFAFPLSVCIMAYRHLFIEKLQSLSNRFSPVLVVLWVTMAGLFFTLSMARTLFFVAFIAISIFYLDKIKSIPKFLRFLGDHSYEIYLVHFPFLDSYGFVLGRKPLALFFGLYCMYIISLGVALKKASGMMNKLVFPNQSDNKIYSAD
jgi:peptidoglycan/LPS O-acetylase OafA/YrhL